jgi:hypothetical protein
MVTGQARDAADLTACYGRSEMTEAPSNQSPIEQLALKWLQTAEANYEPGMSYLAQLAYWGLEKGEIEDWGSSPRYELEDMVSALLGLKVDEQATFLLSKLQQAESPQEAALVVIEVAYDRMVAEATSNKSEINQLALKWLEQVDPDAQSGVSYLAQLAHWGLESGEVTVPEPRIAGQPSPHNLEIAVGMLLEWGPEKAARATRWFLSNPNLSLGEQEIFLLEQLRQAESPQEAARRVIEVAYDMLVASSGYS